MHSRERGFTLVEMLTVIAIMMIILGTLFANFRNFGGVTKLEADAKNIASLIGEARQKSISVTAWGSDYPSFGVYLKDPGTVILYAKCNVDLASTLKTYDYLSGDGACTAPTLVSTLELKGSTITSISYSSASAGTWNQGASIIFVRPDPTILIYKNAGSKLQNTGTLTIELTSKTEPTTRIITVNSNGHIRVGM